MAIRVELINNPYKQRLRILINGESVSVYSNLEQYMDEPFCYWCDKIFDSIYDECNGEDFQLYFSSRKEEMDIMEKLAEKFIHCTQYSSSPLPRPTSLQDRIKDLNSIIKGIRKSAYREFEKTVLFLIPESLQKLRKDLSGMEVRNSFCRLHASTAFYSDYNKQRYNEDIIFLISDSSNAIDSVRRLGISHGFIIEIGNNKRFIDKQGDLFLYETTQEFLFSSIFECLLLSPLLEIFCECINTLSPDIKERYKDKIDVLQSTDISIIPLVERTVLEEGTSSRIKFKTDIEGYSLKSTDLHFSYSEKGIIRCNGVLVEGLKQGKSTLNIFKVGELVPCASCDFTVIKRNRIKELKFDDNDLTLGEGDHAKINLVYLPENADNADRIEWQSDNPQIATVDAFGNVCGRSSGKCTIRCYAEQVSTSCRCVVKRHLKEIRVESKDLDLLYGSETEIKIVLSPENCIDDQITISSLNMRIVNVVGRKLIGIGIGNTKVIIQNKEETVRTDINVRVMNEKEFKKAQKQRERMNSSNQQEKKGWLSKFFG